MIFVPPAHTKGAVVEAIEAGVPLVVIITEGVPVADTAEFFALAQEKGVRLIGPNCPGLISPGKSNVGIIPADITGPGRVGLVSKSGTLTYQMMYELRDFGFSTAIGIGGDPIIGTTHIDALAAFEADPDTEVIVMIGEIGGDAEERAAAYIKEHVTKPVVGYVAGFTAPEGKTMGHAGAIVSRLVGHRAGEEGGPRGRRRQGRQDAVRDRRARARAPGLTTHAEGAAPDEDRRRLSRAGRRAVAFLAPTRRAGFADRGERGGDHGSGERHPQRPRPHPSAVPRATPAGRAPTSSSPARSTGRPRWVAGVLAALQAALLSFLVIVLPAIAAYVATSADPSNDGVGWFRSVGVGCVALAARARRADRRRRRVT